MIKRLIVAAIIFGIASSAGFLPSKKSIGIRSAFAAADAVIDENDRVVLHGNIHSKARPEFDVGPTDPSLPMNRTILLLKIAPEKQAELDRLVAEQQDPSSPNFHHWLTPEEFGKRFGRTPEEIATVKGWLISHGFTIDETAKSGAWINFSGTAADVDRAFHAEMHDYFVNGQLRHANSTAPSIPRALADLVAGPVSLHSFPSKAMHTPPRHIFDTEKPQPNYTEPDNGGYDLAPGDFAGIYDVNAAYNMGYDGAGVTIAIVGRTLPPAAIAKWNIFRSTFKLPYNPPVVIVNGPTPGDQGPDDDAEADLDVEWSGAVAKGATIKFVTSKPTNVTRGEALSAQYIVDKSLASIMSECFGQCESNNSIWNAFYNTLWQQAASQGITVVIASGDIGVYGCDETGNNGLLAQPLGVNGFASTPYNIAVGGTTLSDASTYWNPVNSKNGTSALGYMPEVAWNEWNAQEDWTQYASGGGASSLYPKPAWQVCPGVPNDGARDLPDVSLNADVNIGYRVYTCTNDTGLSCGPNSWSVYGGTSVAAPSFAGIMALIVQSAGGQRQGNFNSVLYQLGNAQYSGASGASAVFHDITSGNNGFGENLPGYSCTPYYDLVTGLGTVDVANLLLAFQEGGSLTVTIGPASAVSAGAMWKIDNGQWNASGATVTGVGPHTLKFKSVPGCKTPAAQKIVISYGQAGAASGTYVVPPILQSFQIDGGATTTSSPKVTLNNTTTGGTPTYYIAYIASQFDYFGGPAWKPYSPAPSFTLSGAKGMQTVYFMVKNAAGVSKMMHATIKLE
ncbi:MAG: S53 family peptidase [Syntrophobacteraceae bacterium]|jgi:subtilase family serine protease